MLLAKRADQRNKSTYSVYGTKPVATQRVFLGVVTNTLSASPVGMGKVVDGEPRVECRGPNAEGRAGAEGLIRVYDARCAR